jgi:hypothetical protein
MTEQYMVLVATCEDKFLCVYESHLSKDEAENLATTLLNEVDEFDNKVYEQVNICQHGDYDIKR